MSVVVITGASAGIGRALVREFAAAGWDVALLARDQERLAAGADEVRERGRRALAIEVDVADADAVEAAAARVEAELGEIDVWINNAAVSVLAPIIEIDPAEFRRVSDVTYLGVVHGTLSALRRMRPRGRGTIVQVSSGLAYRSYPLQAPYCAAKAAVRGFTDSLRAELRHDRSDIRLTLVNLPAVNTPQFSWIRSRMARLPRPTRPVYQPEDIARKICRAAQRPKREVNIGWPVVFGRVGQALVPGLMDRYIAATAWSGQLTDDPDPGGRPDLLDAPVAARVGAHGTFDAEAEERVASRRQMLLGALVGAAVATGLGLRRLVLRR